MRSISCPGHNLACTLAAAEATSAGVLAVRDGILRSVAVATASSSRPAILVSGGLDSAAVAAAAQRLHGRSVLLVALRAGFSSEPEILAQDRLAKHLALDLATVDAVPAFDWQALKRINTNSLRPAGGIFSHIWDALADVARQEGADVLLTGEGGDDVFARSPALARDLLTHGRPGLAWLCAAQGLQTGPLGIAASLLGFGTADLVPPVSKWPPPDWLLITERERRRSRSRWASRLSAAASVLGGWQAAVTAAWIDEIRFFGPKDSRGNLPVMHPLACRRVARVVASTSADEQMGWAVGGSDKDLLRRAVRSWLPPQVSETRKIRSRFHFHLALATADWTSKDAAPALDALQSAGMVDRPSFPKSPAAVRENDQLLVSRAISLGCWLAGGRPGADVS